MIRDKKKKEIGQTNCLLCFNAKSFIKMKIFLGEVKLGITKINFNGLVQVNIRRSVFWSFRVNFF